MRAGQAGTAAEVAPVTALGDALEHALADFARVPHVLLAVDFDGTLAPFVSDPAQARAVPGSLETLRRAGLLPGVTAAVVSGRDLATLAAVTGPAADPPVVLIGSHGAEARGAPSPLTPERAAALDRLRADLETVARGHPQARLERKVTAVALHTRGLAEAVAAPALAAARQVATRHTGVDVLAGKDVVELSVVRASKGAALRDLARVRAVDATAYLGDDVTDERAFAALSPASGDLTIKVGDGPTAAEHRVPGIPSVVEVLRHFVALRARQR